MHESNPENGPTSPGSQPALRLVEHLDESARRGAVLPAEAEGEPAEGPGTRFLEALQAAEERTHALTARIEHVQAELELVRASLAVPEQRRVSLPYAGASLRFGVLAMLASLLALTVWARSVEYPLRVTSDTPTFIALVASMAQKPFTAQSPFLDASVATQHATPYIQLLAFVWRLLPGSGHSALAIGNFLALIGIAVFAFTLWCVFLYVRRLAGSTAAWVSIPVLLGIFGPPHVIWASDLSLHAALYAAFFPQNIAIGTTLLTLLALERRSVPSLLAACLLAALTMLAHPFTGVLLSVLATAGSCRLALHRDRAAARGPAALSAGFALGLLWPAYSLDQAFTETGVRGVVFIALCIAAPLVALGVSYAQHPRHNVAGSVARLLARLGSDDTAFRLALVGLAGTAAIAAWELALVHFPPHESARLAIYWVDERWRWPLLLVAGTVGISGLARLARRGQVVPPIWFVGCFFLGTLGAVGLPLPVWYRFLLLCQIPLAVGVATIVGDSRRLRTTAIIAATFALALSVKAVTLLHTPPTVSYFGQPLQTVWSLGEHLPPGPGLVATDPATSYFIPAVSGRKVLTVDKGHVSSNRELALSARGYQLLRRYYAGGPDWWQAGQEMWRRGVRFVVVQKQTTLAPPTLADFIWQSALLRTPAQRRALGNYFYENNRVGDLIYDSDDFVVYRLDRRKLFGSG
jgi:hypothetical protein